jgi:Fe-S-cluster containining protein
MRLSMTSIDKDLVKKLALELEPHDVLRLVINREGQVIVTLALPLDRERGRWVEQEITLSANEDGPIALQMHAKSLLRSALKAIQDQETDAYPPEVPCATCIAACCRHPFEITLTDSDIERMRSAPEKVRKHVMKREREGLFGEVAYIDKKKLKNPVTGEVQEVCSLLHKDGYCSIHPWRPQVCRDWDPWSCEMKVDDPKANKKRLPLWQE